MHDCPVAWDTNGTLAPGDDKVTTWFFVDDVHVSITTPIASGSRESVTVDPRNVTISHPLDDNIDQTWPRLNDTEPATLRPIVDFESRPQRLSDDNGNPYDYGWGDFVTFYPPSSLGLPWQSMSEGWCYDWCLLKNGTYLTKSHGNITPFPNGLVIQDYQNWDSDQYVSDEFYEAKILCETAAHCNFTSSLNSTLDQGNATYLDLTPDVAWDAGVNQASVALDPKHHHENATLALASPRAISLKRDAPNTTATAGSHSVQTVQRQPSTPDALLHGRGARTRPVHHVLSVQNLSPNPPGPKRFAGFILLGLATGILALAWLLFHRIQTQNTLDQETRRRVHIAIAKSQGMRETDIARHLGLHRKSVKHHLERLLQSRIIKTDQALRPRYYLVNCPDAEMLPLAGLNHPKARALHEALQREREADHSTLARIMGVSVATVGRLVNKLEIGGVVTQERRGHRVVVRLAMKPSASSSILALASQA
jgi:predicted transcriptional regulator